MKRTWAERVQAHYANAEAQRKLATAWPRPSEVRLPDGGLPPMSLEEVEEFMGKVKSRRCALPTPGSPQAVEEGCRCPRGENCNGRGYMGITNIYVYTADCPLHGTGACCKRVKEGDEE